MNSKLKICTVLASFALAAGLCACTPSDGGVGNGGNGGNGGNSTVTQPSEMQSVLAPKAEKIIAGAPKGETKVPDGATRITENNRDITKAGVYYVNSQITGKKITVGCEGVTLYLSGAKLSNEKKVIESTHSLTVTLLGENTVSNSNEAGSNAIDCAGDLIINGSGSLKITSTKNGIKANSVSVIDATVDVTSANDGLHAEVEAYDLAASEPTPSYDDGGYVYLNGACVTVNSAADGIQADTFIYISGGTLDITAGGGAPKTATANLSGKGIKAGPVDWGAGKTDLDWNECLIHVRSGDVNINANDDAIHSDGEANIESGNVTLKTGDDAIHADVTLNVAGGKVIIPDSHEGFESFCVNIFGGDVSITADDDGINAGGGADSSGFGGNGGDVNPWGPRPPRAAATAADSAEPKASINVSGGKVYINSNGDGIDSNGNITVSGGELYVDGPTSSMDAPIDFEGEARVTGGTVVATGSGNMAQNFGNSSAQGSILYILSPSGSGKVSLENGNGELLSFTPTKNYSSVLVSCPEIVKGGTYTLNAGGKSTSITMTELIYGKGFSMGGK